MPEFILDVTEKEMEQGSKFATAGLHLAELEVADWENVGKSIKFPFTIVEENTIDSGKQGKLTAGIAKDAVWKLGEILRAAGVAYSINKAGKITFKGEDCAGKQIKVLYIQQKDSRSAKEGGKGTVYTKAETAYSPDTQANSLGI